MSCNEMSVSLQNQFIDALGFHVKKTIIHDIKEDKYFALLLDSTPDVSHIDQMTVIIRYIKIKDEIAEVKESFIAFIPMKHKTASEIARMILDRL